MRIVARLAAALAVAVPLGGPALAQPAPGAMAVMTNVLAAMRAQVITMIQQGTATSAAEVTSIVEAAGQAWGRQVALDALQKNADALRKRGVKL